MVVGDVGCGAQAHKELSRLQRRHLALLLGRRRRGARLDDVEGLSLRSLLEDRAPHVELLLDHRRCELLELGRQEAAARSRGVARGVLRRSSPGRSRGVRWGCTSGHDTAVEAQLGARTQALAHQRAEVVRHQPQHRARATAAAIAAAAIAVTAGAAAFAASGEYGRLAVRLAVLQRRLPKHVALLQHKRLRLALFQGGRVAVDDNKERVGDFSLPHDRVAVGVRVESRRGDEARRLLDVQVREDRDRLHQVNQLVLRTRFALDERRAELGAAERPEHARGAALDSRCARGVVQQRELAKGVAGSIVSDRPVGHRAQEDVVAAALHHIKGVAVVALSDHRLAGLDGRPDEARQHGLELGLGRRGEEHVTAARRLNRLARRPVHLRPRVCRDAARVAARRAAVGGAASRAAVRIARGAAARRRARSLAVGSAVLAGAERLEQRAPPPPAAALAFPRRLRRDDDPSLWRRHAARPPLHDDAAHVGGDTVHIGRRLQHAELVRRVRTRVGAAVLRVRRHLAHAADRVEHALSSPAGCCCCCRAKARSHFDSLVAASFARTSYAMNSPLAASRPSARGIGGSSPPLSVGGGLASAATPFVSGRSASFVSARSAFFFSPLRRLRRPGRWPD
eukprot:7386481-Prymnesium_polylepis.1